MTTPQPGVTGAGLRTPRAAAVAGIVFAVLLATSLVLLILAQPADLARPGSWLADPARRRAIEVALNLVPFAGIAFLWFIGVVRDRIGPSEDKFFGSVFLGSGLLFVAMLFAGSAFAGGLAAEASAHPSGGLAAGTVGFGRRTTWLLLRVYGMRMAAVFTMSTATITRRTLVVPSWIGVTGVLVALVLLVTVGLSLWVGLLFPAWILMLSVDILRGGMRRAVGSDDSRR